MSERDPKTLHSEITALLARDGSPSLLLGGLLREMKSGNKYRLITGHDTSWQDYLKSVGMSYSSANRYMIIDRAYLDGLNLPITEIAGLDKIGLQMVASSKKLGHDNIEYWLSNVKNESREELARLLKYGDVSTDDHEHKLIDVQVKSKCEVCGKTVMKKLA